MSTEQEYLDYLLHKRITALEGDGNDLLTPDEEKDLIFLLTNPKLRKEKLEEVIRDRYIEVAPAELPTPRYGEGTIPKRGDGTSLFSVPGGSALLEHIPKDYLNLVTLMRWIEFMLERVPRKRLPLLLDYYVTNLWISRDVKHEVMKYARGNVVSDDHGKKSPDEAVRTFSLISPGSGGIPAEGTGDISSDVDPADPRSLGNWKLSTEDHMKSLIFINLLAGNVVDKEDLNSLEQNIEVIKMGGEAFYGL